LNPLSLVSTEGYLLYVENIPLTVMDRPYGVLSVGEEDDPPGGGGVGIIILIQAAKGEQEEELKW
jgi:hypothetical protein